MIFVHGFVHGDPHPGNILVSPTDRGGFMIGQSKYGIVYTCWLLMFWSIMIIIIITSHLSLIKLAVLLDHGVYRQLDDEFRRKYCQLWKALILQDSEKIQQLSEHLGVGKYSQYIPVIFTGRTIDRCYFSCYRINLLPS